ncbi:hypothetical protein V6Z11_A12G102600 [Gossypium hirsutum]
MCSFFTSVKEYLRSAINDTLGFQEVNDLGHYLRASLFHRRNTNSILNFLVEKARSQLPSWDAKRLSFAGRVILAQSILLTILSYLMQSTLVPKEIYDSIEELARQFIWGVADGKRKMALMGWDSICQPKLHGGLKFRRLGDQNKAFILKLGYSLITMTEALWVQILKPKYDLVESMTESIMRNRCSYIWTAVAQVWPLLRSNMIWSIGNERFVRCWGDNWVPNVGPLNQYVSGHGNIVLESKVKEMVLVNGYWNLDLFKLWLPEEVVKRIISIPPLLDSVRLNILFWSRMTTSVFSVKSAYYMLKEESWNPKDVN